jgi:hypothetical protein
MTFPSIPGTFHLQVGLFCSLDQLVCNLEMLFDPTLKILCFEVHFILICIAFFSFSEELYQQMLAKALAHYFESKLLLLDVNDFSLKVTFYSFNLS